MTWKKAGCEFNWSTQTFTIFLLFVIALQCARTTSLSSLFTFPLTITSHLISVAAFRKLDGDDFKIDLDNDSDND